MNAYVVYSLPQAAAQVLLLVALSAVIFRMGYRGLWIGLPVIAATGVAAMFLAIASEQDRQLPAELRGKVDLPVLLNAMGAGVWLTVLGALCVLGVKGVARRPADA